MLEFDDDEEEEDELSEDVLAVLVLKLAPLVEDDDWRYWLVASPS